MEWTLDRVQSLLQAPQTLLADSLGRQWIEQQGGLPEVYRRLRELPLDDIQHKVLHVILTYRGATAATYAHHLAMHRATYYTHYKRLTTVLLAFLQSGAFQRGLGQASTSAITTPFPVPTSSIMGRDSERAVLRTALLITHQRLITLLGPGGIGKTRLAMQIGNDLKGDIAHGAVFVDLAPVTASSMIASAIIHAAGFQEPAGTPARDHLLRCMHHQHCLLILDNFEQHLAAAPLVAELLAFAPQIMILVTSRIPLRIGGEQEFPLNPLGLPVLGAGRTAEQILAAPAAQLFLARTAAISPNLRILPVQAEIVGRICKHLDGLPLAIELAATWTKLLPLSEILERIQVRLRLLNSSNNVGPARHQTMRAAINWSYDLLVPEEQEIFARCGVFMGGFTAAEGEVVCGTPPGSRSVLEVLMALVNQNLCSVMHHDDGSVRIVMLEVIREYALERLDASRAAEEVRRRHAEVYCSLAERAIPAWNTADQPRWLRQLDPEIDNLRTALRWAVQHRQVELAARLGQAFDPFLGTRGLSQEAESWLREIIDLLSSANNEVLHTRVLTLLAMNLVAQGRIAEAEPLMCSALDSYRRRGMEQELGRNLSHLGLICRRQGRYDETRQSYTESHHLAKKINDTQGIVVALNGLGTLAYWEGDVEAAQTLFVQCVDQARSIPNLAELAQYTGNLASVFGELGEGEQARQYALESLALRRILQVPMNIGDALNTLGSVLIGLGEYAQARGALLEGLQIRLQHVDVALPFMLETLAELALAEDDPPMTVMFYSSATKLRAQFGTPRPIINQQLYDQTLAAARAHITTAVSAQMWQRGQTMSVEEICRHAISNQSLAS